MTRVAVVGGGLAGAATALRAARSADVVMVSKAPGATALYSGAVEIWPGPQILLPHHPFSRLGLDAPGLTSIVDRAVEAAREALAGAGLNLVGGAGQYLDVQGRRRPAQLVPETAARGELGSLRGVSVAVASVRRLAGCDAPSVAAAFQAAGVDAAAVDVDPGPLPVDPGLADLGALAAPEVDAQAVAYPPGFAALPANGFELLASSPSPHGWRLHNALRAAVVAAGVEVRAAEIDSFEVHGRRVSAALAAGERLEADWFVIATGRFLAGGIVKDRIPREPLLGLPVFSDGLPVEWDPIAFRRRERVSGDLTFRSGLMTDAHLRPVDSSGAPVYDNLMAAGSVLGGYDLGEGYGFGVPLVTGWLAGGLIA